MNNFNFDNSLLLFCLTLFLIILLICLLINKVNFKIKFGFWPKSNLKKFVTILKIKNLSAIGLFILFVYQFIWFNRLFIINNIKTSKIVIETSHLLQTKQDLLKTKKIACFIEKEQEVNMAISSPNKNNILNQIYREKTRFRNDQIEEMKIINNKRCLMPRIEQRVANFAPDDFYAVVSKSLFNLIVVFLTEVGFNHKIWTSSPIQQYNLVFYYNDKDPMKEYFSEK